MQTWEVLAAAIPRGKAERVARLLRCSVDTVNRWCRPPEGADNNNTGRYNPLDDLLAFVDALNGTYPPGVDVVQDFLNSEFAAARACRGEGGTITKAEAERELRAMARRCGEMADQIAMELANGKEG